MATNKTETVGGIDVSVAMKLRQSYKSSFLFISDIKMINSDETEIERKIWQIFQKLRLQYFIFDSIFYVPIV